MAMYSNPYYQQPAGGMYPQYPQNYGASMSVQQSYAQAPQTPFRTAEWVDGEVAARAYPMPAGWPAGAMLPLWDNSDQVIYLKSWNAMGAPAPLQKLRYTWENAPGALPAGNSGMSGEGQSGHGGTEQYVTKADLDAKMAEIREMLKNVSGTGNGGNQNGSGNGQNRGGQR